VFLLDSLLLAPGKAVLSMFEELAKKAQEDFLDDGAVKQELQEIYGRLEAGSISEQEFEARELGLLRRLEQIARAKFEGSWGTETMGGERAFLDGDWREEENVELTEPMSHAEVLPEVAPLLGMIAAAAPEPKQHEEPADPVLPPPPAPVAVAVAAAALTMPEVIESSMRQLAMLKLKVSALTSVARADTGWRVTAELLERKAVPDTSDLLGVYELQLDEAGNLLRYERTHMRRRCDLGR
jgi:hypothetical protein